MKKLRVTLMGDETVELVERLCAVTGLNPPSLMALLLRKYGKELEMWIGHAPSAPTPSRTPPPLELPTNPGENLMPIEL